MNKLKHLLVLLLALGWLVLSFKSVYGPFAPITKLMSYPEGIFFRNLPSDGASFAGTGYECTVHLDELGVPTIKGTTANDVAFGLGYMHARDRYFQMEMITRTVQGSLSEVMGSLTLKSDIFWKPLRCEERAIADMQNLQKEHPISYAYMMAYSEGIRHYLTSEKGGERFFEYALLGEKPREWKDHYPFLLSFYMSKILAYDEYDLAWATNLSHLSDAEYEAFYKTNASNYPFVYPGLFQQLMGAPTEVKADSNMALAPFDADQLERNLSIGSNNWAISKGKSASGNAILCNDTHLDITLPNPWYQAHLQCSDFHVQGFTIPCSPYVLTGNNAHISWGITNCQWDEVDLFTLNIGADTNTYMVNGVAQAFEPQQNTVLVKGQADHVFTTRHTSFGIAKKGANGWYAEKWHALDFYSSSPAFEKIARSTNWNQFREALTHYTFPPQNFAYADVQGNVGGISAGKLPARSNAYRGEMMDGTTPYIAQYVDFDNLPQYYRGDTGFTSSANQWQAQANYYLNYTWVEPYRGARIQEVLSADNITRDQLKGLHLDKMDQSYRQTIALFDSLPLEGRQKAWLDELKQWNGQMAPDQKTPVKYLVIYKSLKNYFDAYFKGKGVEWGPSYHNVLQLMQADSFTVGATSLATANIKKVVLDSALVLFDRFVTEETTYGQLSPFTMRHILRIPGLEANIPGKGGNSNTVDVNSHGVHGASMRTVIEMNATKPVIETILAGGQSGRVNSPHYMNQVSMWQNGQYHTIDFQAAEALPAMFTFTK